MKEQTVTFENGVKKHILVNRGRTSQEILEQTIQIVAQHPEMMEWRVDYFDHVEEMNHLLELMPKIRQISGTLPILITFRSKKNGGQTDLISEDAYLNLVKIFIDFKLGEAVDIELNHTADRVADLLATAQKQHLLVVKQNF